jgi:hypothetical protein
MLNSQHSWHAYERDAWGADDYHPISKRGDNISESGGIGVRPAQPLQAEPSSLTHFCRSIPSSTRSTPF